jgi:hypothetical protein
MVSFLEIYHAFSHALDYPCSLMGEYACKNVLILEV